MTAETVGLPYSGSPRPKDQGPRDGTEDVLKVIDLVDRKRRTRELIQLGGVLSAWGIDTSDQADELMKQLTSAERKGWCRYMLGALGARWTER